MTKEKKKMVLAGICLAFSILLVVFGKICMDAPIPFLADAGAEEGEPQAFEPVPEEESAASGSAIGTADAPDPPEPLQLSVPGGKLVVMIDAGHGGSSTGTFSRNLVYPEKTVNLAVARYVQEQMAPYRSQGVKICLSREGDETVSLKKRLKRAEKKKADLLISIHCNGDTSRSTNGIETLYTDRKLKRLGAKQRLRNQTTSRDLALACQERLLEALGLEDRGIICRNDLYLLRHTRIPGVILELGFMSNKEDMRLLRQEIYQRKAADAICQVILGYCGQPPPN